jgi:AcrR family transcriptional regulator
MTDGRTERAKAAREQRELQILEAALQVFAARGYHGTSVSDLVDAAGVARGTFYLYFDSKQAVFLALLERLLVAMRGAVLGVDTRAGAAPLTDQVVAILRAFLTTAAGSRALTTIVFREAVVLDQAVQERVREHEGAFLAWISGSLRNGVALGLLRPHDPDLAAVLIYGAVRHVLERCLDDHTTAADIDRLARGMVDHHLHGLLPPVTA